MSARIRFVASFSRIRLYRCDGVAVASDPSGFSYTSSLMVKVDLWHTLRESILSACHRCPESLATEVVHNRATTKVVVPSDMWVGCEDAVGIVLLDHGLQNLSDHSHFIRAFAGEAGRAVV